MDDTHPDEISKPITVDLVVNMAGGGILSKGEQRMISSPIDMMDVTRYVPLRQAHELAVRQSELYEAMLIVEQCGASPELTEAITRLGGRMRHIQADLQSACKQATGIYDN